MMMLYMAISCCPRCCLVLHGVQDVNQIVTHKENQPSLPLLSSQNAVFFDDSRNSLQSFLWKDQSLDWQSRLQYFTTRHRLHRTNGRVELLSPRSTTPPPFVPQKLQDVPGVIGLSNVCSKFIIFPVRLWPLNGAYLSMSPAAMSARNFAIATGSSSILVCRAKSPVKTLRKATSCRRCSTVFIPERQVWREGLLCDVPWTVQSRVDCTNQ